MSVSENWDLLQSRILALNPKRTVHTIVVSKTRTISEIEEACRCGIFRFGENKIQEALSKFPQISTEKNIELHHIGPVQSGTLRKLFGNFHYTHGVCSLSTLQELSKQSEKTKHKLKFFLQLNLTAENTKSGFTRKDFLENVQNFSKYETEYLEFFGLMTMGPSNEDPVLTRQVFRELHLLRTEYLPDKKLSMGMSGDFEIAIQENTDYIRVGSLLFGHRDYSKV